MKPLIKLSSDYKPPAPRRRVFARVGGSSKVNAANGSMVVEIFDEIGGPFGITESSVSAALRSAAGQPIEVQINSPGGNVFAGIAIHNQLAAYAGKVTVKIIALAASAASIIAMAGDEVQIADGAFLMIHNSWGVTLGNAAEHIEVAGLLTEIDAAMSRKYAAKTGIDQASIDEMMAAETWLGAQAAVDAGFADVIVAQQPTASAKFDLSSYRNVPSGLSAAIAEPSRPKSPVELERVLHQGERLSRADAKLVARGGWNAMTDAPADINAENEISKLMAEVARATAALKGKAK
jgi:ATP-dependent Clp protease, protease subunit